MGCSTGGKYEEANARSNSSSTADQQDGLLCAAHRAHSLHCILPVRLFVPPSMFALSVNIVVIMRSCRYASKTSSLSLSVAASLAHLFTLSHKRGPVQGSPPL